MFEEQNQALQKFGEQTTVALKQEVGKLPTELSPADAEALLVYGDLEKLSAEGRLIYYAKRCRDLNINPAARPFDYLRVKHPEIPGQMRMLLYLNKTGGELLRENNHVSIEVIEEKTENGYFEVKVLGTRPIIHNGAVIVYRKEHEIGGVEVAGKSGMNLANARMKAYTKAKRRVSIALCAAGMSDDTEIETIPGATRVPRDEAEAPQPVLSNDELNSVGNKFSS